MGHPGTVTPREWDLWFPGLILRIGVELQPGVFPLWAWVGGPRSVRRWWAWTVLRFCCSQDAAPTVQSWCRWQRGTAVPVPCRELWRGPGHLFPQKNGECGGGCGMCNRSIAFPE